jgi:hypothetical protein
MLQSCIHQLLLMAVHISLMLQKFTERPAIKHIITEKVCYCTPRTFSCMSVSCATYHIVQNWNLPSTVLSYMITIYFLHHCDVVLSVIPAL